MKTELIEFFKEVEGDDKIYFQNPTGLAFEKRSLIVPAIAGYRADATKELLHLKVRDAISALNCETGDFNKFIYIITDTKFGEDYQLEKVFDICKRLDLKVVCFTEISSLRKSVSNHYREVLNES